MAAKSEAGKLKEKQRLESNYAPPRDRLFSLELGYTPNNLRAVRYHLCMSIDELADVFNVYPSTVKSWEHENEDRPMPHVYWKLLTEYLFEAKKEGGGKLSRRFGWISIPHETFYLFDRWVNADVVDE